MSVNTTNKIRNATENHRIENGEIFLLPTNMSEAYKERWSLIPYRHVGKKSEILESKLSDITSTRFKGWTLNAFQAPTTNNLGLSSLMPNTSPPDAPTLLISPKTI